MEWNEYSFQQEFTLSLRRLERRQQASLAHRLRPAINSLLGVLSNALQALRRKPELHALIQQVGSQWLAALPPLGRGLVGLAALWWLGMLLGFFAGLVWR